MMTYLPTLKQLQYLVALKDHGHFGRAAEACFVTQSTLSAGLRELETLIGVTLVERTRRVVRFTPLGARIAEKGRCVLLALPFGCGEVDNAPLFDDRLWVAFPAGEAPPAESEIVPQSIEEDRLLLLEDGHCLKDHALAACNRPELRAEATMLGTSLRTLVQMVDNGLGVTMLPEMAIAAGILEHTGLVARALEADNPARRIALAWRRASPRERDFELLADVLAEGAAPLT